MIFRKLAILGPGLMGGSLLKAARRTGLAGTLAAWARREDAARDVLDLGLADLATSDLDVVVRGADAVVLCTPVESFDALFHRMAPILEEDAVVTDVGSVKKSVVEASRAALGDRARRFVGSHPMAGSETEGIAASRDDLFEGAACVLTPVEETDPGAVDRVRALWTNVGAELHVMPPERHDEMVAAISHVPHVMAAALVHLAAGSHPEAMQCVGNGFRDTTRVASGSPSLWRHIIASNRLAILNELDETVSLLSGFRQALDRSDWDAVEDFLGKARRTRDNFRPHPRRKNN